VFVQTWFLIGFRFAEGLSAFGWRAPLFLPTR